MQRIDTISSFSHKIAPLEKWVITTVTGHHSSASHGPLFISLMQGGVPKKGRKRWPKGTLPKIEELLVKLFWTLQGYRKKLEKSDYNQDFL